MERRAAHRDDGADGGQAFWGLLADPEERPALPQGAAAHARGGGGRKARESDPPAALAGGFRHNSEWRTTLLPGHRRASGRSKHPLPQALAASVQRAPGSL